MRDILFKGKTEEGKWVEGYLFVLGKGTEYEETYILGDLDHRESVHDIWKCAERVIPETVGQFSGQVDKNGKKIFEGDVLEFYGSTTGYVTYNRGCFSSCIRGSIREFAYLSFSVIEIIGNIHDNYELLEGR